MLWAAESIYDGTWGDPDAPLEVLHYELMREMGWTFAELMATPVYVVRYCTDLMLIRREAENEARKKANQQGTAHGP